VAAGEQRMVLGILAGSPDGHHHLWFGGLSFYRSHIFDYYISGLTAGAVK